MAAEHTTPQKKIFQLSSPDSSPLFIPSAKNCIFCLSNTEDEVHLGELLSSEDVSVHYNCLLSASILAQKVGDDEGIRGFTVPVSSCLLTRFVSFVGYDFLYCQLHERLTSQSANISQKLAVE